MSFHQSAQDIRVDEGRLLRARLQNDQGEFVDAELDLNQHIGNNDGRFEWDASGFADSASNVTFSIEGGGSVPILRAALRDSQGNEQNRDLNLGERIGNQGGQFVYN